MKLTTGMLAVVGMTLGGVAFAQDAAVSAQKTGVQSIVPGAYGKVEVRHSTFQEQRDEDTVRNIPKLSVRPTLGATFFDGKVDTSLTWIFQKEADTATVTRPYLYSITTWTVFSNDYLTIYPYAEIYHQNTRDSWQDGYIGTEFDAKYDINMAPGTLTFTAFTVPLVQLNGRTYAEKQKSPARNEHGGEGLFLTKNDKGEDETKQRDPNLLNWQGYGVKFAPAAVNGLTVGITTNFDHTWSPKYVEKEVDGALELEQDGYQVKILNTQKLTATYKINDSVTLGNQLRQYMNGVYAEGRTGKGFGGTTWENRLFLQATLF